MKAKLHTLARRSVAPYIRVVRSTGSFIATANNVNEVALREKNLLGNQCFLLLNPCIVSAAMASEQISEATATYMPIHGIGPSSRLSISNASPGIDGQSSSVIDMEQSEEQSEEVEDSVGNEAARDNRFTRFYVRRARANQT